MTQRTVATAFLSFAFGGYYFIARNSGPVRM